MTLLLNILAPGPWDSFAAYSALHALTLVVCLLLIAAPSLLGRALPKNGNKAGELSLRRALPHSPSATGSPTISGGTGTASIRALRCRCKSAISTGWWRHLPC